MRWLTLDEILHIHQRVIETTGGEQGVLSLSALEASLFRPLASFEGVDAFSDFLEKIAALIHGIITSHPFVDGNKRVALVAADVCLRMNGMRIRPSSEVEEFFWAIARGERDVNAIAQWLRTAVETIPTTD